MHVIPVMMNWKIIHLPQQHRKKLILFYAETAAGNLHFRNTKKAVALTAMQDLIQNAVYMRIFISVVQMQRIQNSKKFWILSDDSGCSAWIKNSCPIYDRAAVFALRDILETVENCEGVASAKWRGSDLYRYKIPPKKPRISPVYPPLQRTTVIFVTKDIPPIMQIKNPARRPIVVHPISETARKAAEACESFTCLLIEFHNV